MSMNDKKMNETTRTARLVALMAGNGFVLVQVIQWHVYLLQQSHVGRFSVGYVLLGLGLDAFVGIATAYCALVVSPKHQASFWLEAASCATIASAFSFWLGLAR
jgi:hypothetical protein